MKKLPGLRYVSRWYVLGGPDGHTPIYEPDILKAAKAFENFASRRVAKTELPGGLEVSTVFLGLDHSWGDEAPQLFETMVFDGDDGGTDQWRCSTWAEAEAQHAAAVAKWTKTYLDS
jgi:hypothetical protein